MKLLETDVGYIRLLLMNRGDDGAAQQVLGNLQPNLFGNIILPKPAAKFMKLVLIAQGSPRSQDLARRCDVTDEGKFFTIELVESLDPTTPVVRKKAKVKKLKRKRPVRSVG